MDEDNPFADDQDSHGNIFNDIEDNNPSFSSFIDQSLLNNPYNTAGISESVVNSPVRRQNGLTPSVLDETSTLRDSIRDTSAYQPSHHLDINDSLTISSQIAEILRDRNLAITITNANRAGSSSVVLYTVQLIPYDIVVHRRYSEFDSLRQCLMKLFPSKIVPPIPEKHSLLNYIILNKDIAIIETRKRLLTEFLHGCVAIREIRTNEVFIKFLDPNERNWSQVVNSPPMTYLPNSPLLGDPINPTNQNGLYSLLPIPYQQGSSASIPAAKLGSEFPEFLVNFEHSVKINMKIFMELDRITHTNYRNFNKLINILVELGGNLNNFSLQITGINLEIEKFGSTIDRYFLNFEAFNVNNNINFKEPIHQFILNYKTCLSVIGFYKLKILQLKILTNSRGKKEKTIKILKEDTKQAERLDMALREGAKNSPTIAEAVKRYESAKSRKNLGWYGIFGGSGSSNSSSSLNGGPLSPRRVKYEANVMKVDEPVVSTVPPETALQQKREVERLEAEIEKLDQLINLLNTDIIHLTNELGINFNKEITEIKRKWLLVMINYVNSGRVLFRENLECWGDLHNDINSI